MMKNFSFTKLKRGKSIKSTKTKKSVQWSEELEEIHFYNPESDNFASEDASVTTKVEDNFALEKQTKINNETTRTKVNHTTFQPQWKQENMPLSQEHVHSISVEKRKRLALQNILAVKQESECFGEDWVWHTEGGVPVWWYYRKSVSKKDDRKSFWCAASARARKRSH